MAVDASKLSALLETAFPDATLDLKDMLGDADHYGLTITSSAFEGLNRVRRLILSLDWNAAVFADDDDERT